ncbi:hypothetical protein M0P65_05155 [Candidatus Gracilibacteria bacterium]|nr:hypothetical protein [Candidatus Gracilibacteria bacterium]
MIGYKATYNGKCLNKLYEVGKTYTLDGELVMCLNGFHFCQDLIDVFRYYYLNKDIKVFKIEVLGDIKTEGDKSVTNKLKILEEVSLANLKLEKNGIKYEFNSNGNITLKQTSHDFWAKWEYNENNKCIKMENSDGYWVKWEYDKNNNLIKYETSSGRWEKYEYDENNRIKIETSFSSISSFSDGVHRNLK